MKTPQFCALKGVEKIADAVIAGTGLALSSSWAMGAGCASDPSGALNESSRNVYKKEMQTHTNEQRADRVAKGGEGELTPSTSTPAENAAQRVTSDVDEQQNPVLKKASDLAAQTPQKIGTELTKGGYPFHVSPL